MIEVKEAVKIAKKYLIDLYSEEKSKKIRLEEVELTDDGKYWFITLSFIDPEDNDTPLLPLPTNILTQNLSRTYKIFKVRNSDRKIQAMTIRSTD